MDLLRGLRGLAVQSMTPKVVKTLQSRTGKIDAAVDEATGDAPAPAPEAPAPEAPAKPFRFQHGGKVRGPGTGTSDSINAKVSDGEYILPADTVKALGTENLDAIKDATHAPVQNGLRGPHYDNGGGVYTPYNEVKPNTGLATVPGQAPLQQPSTATSPGTGMTPVDGTARTGYNPNFTMGDAPGAAPAGPAAGAAPTGVPPTMPNPNGAAYNNGLRAGQVAKTITGAGGGALNAAGNAITAAAPFVPHWDAYGDKSGMTAPEKGQLLARDTLKGLAGIAGGAVGGGVGSLAGPVGTVAGGILGGGVAMNSADHVMDDVRRGTNWVNEKLGGSKDYFEDSDVSLKRNGFDPNKTMLSMAVDGVKNLAAPSAGKPAAAAAPAPAAPAPADTSAYPNQTEGTAEEANNAERFGVPVYQQRNAQAISAVGLRGGAAHENLTTDPQQANANLRASVAGIPQGEQALVHGLDSGTKIYAGRDGNGRLNLTGTGDGSADAAYRGGAQYQNGMAQAAGDRDKLAQIEAGHAADARESQRSGLMSQIANSNGDMGKLAAAKAGLRQMNATDLQSGLISKDLAVAGMNKNAAYARLNYDMQKDQRDHNYTVGKDQRDFKRTSENDTFEHGNTASDELTKKLTALHTTGTDKDGKPIVDYEGMHAARTGIEHSVAALGGKSMADLSQPTQDKLLSASKLLTKMKAQGSNNPLNPFAPDFLKTTMPHDLTGLHRMPNGDYQITARGPAAGQVIPARFIHGENAKFLGGLRDTPTTEFDSLINKGK